MPIVQALMDSLVARYGKAKGENVYYAMEAEGKGPFATGAKHHDLHLAFVKKHGLPSAASPAPRRTPTRRPRGAAKPRR